MPFLDGSLGFMVLPKPNCINDPPSDLTSHQKFCLFLSCVFKQRYATKNLPEDNEYQWMIFSEMLWVREVCIC